MVDPIVQQFEDATGMKVAVNLSTIRVPDIDLSQLSDLEATIALLRETGVLP